MRAENQKGLIELKPQWANFSLLAFDAIVMNKFWDEGYREKQIQETLSSGQEFSNYNCQFYLSGLH